MGISIKHQTKENNYVLEVTGNPYMDEVFEISPS